MEDQASINAVIIWVFPFLLLIISFLFKRDQKQRDDDQKQRDDETKEMKKEFRDFMKSQVETNQVSSEALLRVSFILEANGLDKFEKHNK